jgi:hypothetical protein
MNLVFVLFQLILQAASHKPAINVTSQPPLVYLSVDQLASLLLSQPAGIVVT